MSNTDKTTLDVPKTARKAKAKTRGKAVKMDSHRTVEDSEQTKPAKSARRKISSQKTNFTQSGVSGMDKPLPAAQKQKSKHWTSKNERNCCRNWIQWIC